MLVDAIDSIARSGAENFLMPHFWSEAHFYVLLQHFRSMGRIWAGFAVIAFVVFMLVSSGDFSFLLTPGRVLVQL